MTGVEEVPVIGLRRKIAEKMAISKRSAAHFSYFEEVDVTELESLRQHLNSARAENQPKLTYLPFIIQGLIKALKKFTPFFFDVLRILYILLIHRLNHFCMQGS